MKLFKKKIVLFLTVTLCFLSAVANINASTAVDPTTATVQALRLNGVITGGAIPYGDPVFTSMVNYIESGNYQAAAAVAIDSKYFPYYLPRRMAKEMMNPQMSEAGIPDNDDITFIVANLLGLAGSQPSIGSLWSQNATYCIDLTQPHVSNLNNKAAGSGACAANQQHVFYAGSTAGVGLNFDWTTAIVKNNLQVTQPVQPAVFNTVGLPPVTLMAKDVGGYMTLADVQNTGNPSSLNTFAEYAFQAGTNLRAAEYLYEIAFGVTLAGMEVTNGATADMTPAFVPSNDPNFLVGHNQTACIACHGGGATSRLHGYAAFADIFSWSSAAFSGFIYTPNPIYAPNPAAVFINEDTQGVKDPSEGLRKSFGSNPLTRIAVYNCLQNPSLQTSAGTVCNPSSPGVSPTQGWDLSLWQTSGLLTSWGWQGPVTGNGVNALGTAVGQATGVYTFMTQRVVNEICPLGTISPNQISQIGLGAYAQEKAAQAAATHTPASKGAYGYIVQQVATDPSCI